MLAEIDARERRKTCIIIPNVPESASTVGTVRKADDAEALSALFKFCKIEVASDSLVAWYRLGKKETSPRLLKVVFKTETDRNLALEGGKCLRKLPETHQFRGIYINPDRTFLERKAFNEVRSKRNKKPVDKSLEGGLTSEVGDAGDGARDGGGSGDGTVSVNADSIAPVTTD